MRHPADFAAPTSVCGLAAAIVAAACTRAPARRAEPTSTTSIDSSAVAVELVRNTQALVDAIAPGDTAIWSRTLAADGLFSDENGRPVTKRELLDNLKPLPPGFTGHITVANPRVRVTSTEGGAVAVITYDMLEDETIFGQTLHTKYHGTDTYVRRAGRWQMLASQDEVLPSEHTAVALDQTSLDAYVGTYRLGPGVEYLVARDGARLVGHRAGAPPAELFPLGPDRFFLRGATRGEKIFARDASGRVTRLIDRRDNNDLVWTRAP